MNKSIICSTEEVQALQRGSTLIVRPVDFNNIAKQSGCTQGKLAYSDTFKSWAVFNGNGDAHLCLVDCPFGKVGDVLIGKETWYSKTAYVPSVVIYKADQDSELLVNPSCWLSGATMPKWAVRYHLPITDVRLKLCQEITEEEIFSSIIDKNEYYGWYEDACNVAPPGSHFERPIDWFRQRFERRYSRKGFDWNRNDYLWLIEHGKVEG